MNTRLENAEKSLEVVEKSLKAAKAELAAARKAHVAALEAEGWTAFKYTDNPGSSDWECECRVWVRPGVPLPALGASNEDLKKYVLEAEDEDVWEWCEDS